MTIGIAITLTDGVLFVADGRLTRPMGTGAPLNDSVNKIHRLAENMSAISFGISLATRAALGQLVLALPKASSLDDVQSYVDNSSIAGWRDLMADLSPEVDINHPTMRSALVVGGILGDQPFIMGVLERPDGRVPASTTTNEFNFYVLGGEDQDAQGFFTHRVSKVLADYQANSGVGVMNNLVSGLLNSAEETIRFVEKEDSSVGGIIHYAIIRRNFPYTAGQLR